MTDRALIGMFLVAGMVISLGSPVLGALVMLPAFVVIVARRLDK